MSDDTASGSNPFEGVESGPTPSDAAPVVRAGGTGSEAHPSIPALIEKFGGAVLHHEVTAGDEVSVVVDATRVREILEWLKEDEDQHYEFLSDLTAVDFGGGRPLQVVYQLWSLIHRRNLRVKAELPLSGLQIDSVEPLWKTADWLEREVYDLFGIEFVGHPDLRRILMPENYAEGHPLRKDFPLRGRFSREEQTRRALSHDVEDFYIPMEMEMGREPQTLELPSRDAGGDASDED